MRLSRMLGAATLLTSFVLGANAYAGETIGNTSLLELLKEKGVITADEARSVGKKDQAHLFTVGGRVQVQYKSAEQSNSAVEDTNQFFIRRARLTMDARLSPWASARFQPEWGGGKFEAKDVYVKLTPPSLSGFAVVFGNQYVGFSREAVSSSNNLHFVERTVTSQFAPFRNMGLTVHQRLMDDMLKLEAGIFNGSVRKGAFKTATQFAKNQMYHIDAGGFGGSVGQPDDFMYTARVDFSPSGKFKWTQGDLPGSGHGFEVGLAAYTQRFGDRFAANANLVSGGSANGLSETQGYNLDGAFRGAGLSVEFEAILRELKFSGPAAPSGNDTANQLALALQAGYMVVPGKIELAARYENIDFDAGNIYTGPNGEDLLNATTIGVNYYANGHHTKVQANYVINDLNMPGATAEPDSNQFLIQVSHYF